MSDDLWYRLPKHFLKMRFRTFTRLDSDVKRLIVELAGEQKFKCAFCTTTRDLEVEHEHEPNEKVPYSIYNVRGLVCRRCNWHLMAYESEERGAITWENFSSSLISRSCYDDYTDMFECRVRAWHEALLEKYMGHRYWNRRLKLDLLERRYEEGRFPWQRDPHWIMRASLKDPEQLARLLLECFGYVSEQFDKDPSFEPPEVFWKLAGIVKPIIDDVRLS